MVNTIIFIHSFYYNILKEDCVHYFDKFLLFCTEPDKIPFYVDRNFVLYIFKITQFFENVSQIFLYIFHSFTCVRSEA